MKKIILLILFYLLCFQLPFAQDLPKNVSEMTKEEVLDLTYDQLLELPFEDLLQLAEIVGVSLDELYEMILNKDLVSASKMVESSFVSPLSSSVISYDEIIASGARTIEEALRLIPGVVVREKTNGNFDVHIRGNENLPPHHMLLYSENSLTLVMINGRPVYNYVHGGTFWETLPIDFDDIDRIEIIRGPSSALYGPNAVSGVVNIITKRQESKQLKLDANVQGGSQSTVITSLGLGKRLNDKFAFRATGNFQTMNRNSDLLYVHEANQGKGGFIPKQVLDTMTKWSNLEGKPFFVFDPTDDIDEMYPDPMKSRERFGANGYLFFDVNEKLGFDLKGGYQYSNVLSTTMGDNPTSFAGRLSSMGYADLNAHYNGLRAHVNYLGGWQDIVRADTGFKIDIMNLNANAEYDINLGNFQIRPGIAYQLGRYDDSEYLKELGQGFLNGSRDISSLAFSLRADYTAFEKLRFIAAVRGEKYNTHNDLILSYQFTASYNLHDKHFFRAVFSKANRGPFLVDTYADYLWDRIGRPMPGYIHFKGQENLDLLTMNMFEVGYRVKPLKNIQADFEFFMTNTKDYGALYPDSANLNGFVSGTDRPYVSMRYTNIELSSKQIGITANISWVVNENIILKMYGTYQQTVLSNVIPFSPDSAVSYMITDAFVNYTLSGGEIDFSKRFPDERVEEEENRSTPSFYGGMILSLSMFKKKLNLNTNLYTYSSQTFRSKYSTVEIQSKIILNARISYKLYKENVSIFVNVRNLVEKKQEFAYMDQIGSLYLLGLNVNF
jgi:iron complex outermembrane recepter protein